MSDRSWSPKTTPVDVPLWTEEDDRKHDLREAFLLGMLAGVALLTVIFMAMS